MLFRSQHAAGAAGQIALPLGAALESSSSIRDVSPLHTTNNPYATLYYGGEDEVGESVPVPRKSGALQRREMSPRRIARQHAGGTVSKADFIKRCKSIFARYMPAAEAGQIRPHHREFIERNCDRDGASRLLLLTELKRYDLSEKAGLRPQFNREDFGFTEKKLKVIEDRALGSTSE